MLAKKTSKNQITIPSAIVRQLPDTQYFDVSLRGEDIILRPVLVTPTAERRRAVRTKMATLGVTEKDVREAILWARRRRP
jgi:hypothetical protein